MTGVQTSALPICDVEGEMSMQSAVVGVDVVGDGDDDAGDVVVVDEDVEGGGSSGGLGWPCWTPGQGVVGGTCDGLRWPAGYL